jgi:hypothetical protein
MAYEHGEEEVGQPSEKRRNKWDTYWPRIVQVAGLSIALWETVIENFDRPSLLILAAGMMGINAVYKHVKNGS